MNEKQDKFKEFANYRTNQALKYIRLLGNLSNKRAYSYNEKQVKEICDTLKKETENLRSKLLNGTKDDQEFKL
jgi:hypothetical protein